MLSPDIVPYLAFGALRSGSTHSVKINYIGGIYSADLSDCYMLDT
jgi:hypothetical protein